MAKIIGNTTATPNPRPDWNQTDETKADFIKNKPNVVTTTGGTITGNLTITGDLTVNGTTTSEDHETIVVEDNMMVLNSNKVDLQTAVSGIAINKDADSTYGAVYDPLDNTFKFGEGTLNEENEFAFNDGEGLPFAVREDSSKFTNNHIVKWSADGNKLVDSGKTIGDLDYKAGTGLSLSGTTFSLNAASDAIGGVKSGEDAVISGGLIKVPKLNTKADLGELLVDTATAYIKDIPSISASYATISKIGGLSKKSNNELRIESAYAGTNNGVTATYDVAEGTVTLNGTSTGEAVFYFVTNYSVPAGTHYFKTNGSGMGWSSYYGTAYNPTTGSAKYDTGAGVSFTSNGDRFQFQINIVSGRTFNNVVLKPMVNVGDSTLPFEPYFSGLRDAKVTKIISSTDDVILIPESLQNEEWYGVGIPDTDNYNFVDLINDKAYIKAKKYVFTGDEPWMKESATKPYFYLTIGEYGYVTQNSIICNKYEQNSIGASNENIGINVINSNGYNDARIIVRPEGNLTTVEAWKNKLLEWKLAGKHLTAIVGFAESTTKDISDLITNDNLIGVEGGGTLTFENEHKYDVPSEITFYLNANDVIGANEFVGDLKGTAIRAICDSTGRDIATIIDSLLTRISDLEAKLTTLDG